MSIEDYMREELLHASFECTTTQTLSAPIPSLVYELKDRADKVIELADTLEVKLNSVLARRGTTAGAEKLVEKALPSSPMVDDLEIISAKLTRVEIRLQHMIDGLEL